MDRPTAPPEPSQKPDAAGSSKEPRHTVHRAHGVGAAGRAPKAESFERAAGPTRKIAFFETLYGPLEGRRV